MPPTILGMRARDVPVFQAAAVQKKVWILVRATNPKSLEYVGRKGYTPKPVDCKPKTADAPGHDAMGLVADPFVIPDAFKPGKRIKAQELWRRNARFLKLPLPKGLRALPDLKTKKLAAANNVVLPSPPRMGYAVDPDPGPRFGCLRLNGDYLHGDYDLYDIVDVKSPQFHEGIVGVLNGTMHIAIPRLDELRKYLNQKIGAPMIQHGGEAQLLDHSDQEIYLFTPAGEVKVLTTAQEIRQYYFNTFRGREALAALLNQDVNKMTMH